ncbi:COX15/CtaA family protein [Pseudovibrio exalbescens]|uniref:COX15/CtaA family protein n=1 Tax=Pseudovibrio exalbescens TaxID=197461 RepID=UPI002365E3AC|nr:COX15/CtaA family protein [Pseudovibrio exalbescens]MDD7908413.1 COX15/CtaA family protein [Pseudovibrio exalbescens]
MKTASYSHDPLGELERKRRPVRYWLYAICFMILCMVVVGGATRLTESGLSITEWKPIHGVIPPLTTEEWLEELEKYRQIPEYQLINKGMSLEEFKFIFWWEWGHRLLGRAIGVAFFVPLVFFWLRGNLEPWLKPRLVVGFFLGGVQGAIGWWMVASGLVNRVDVSQYRLAIHLTLACVIFGYLLYIARLLAPTQLSQRVEERQADVSNFGLAWFIMLLVFAQIFLGGIVAGLNAGLAYNTWPLMDGEFIPDGLLIMSPWYLNFFENVLTVQFQHRMMAYFLTAVIAYQTVLVLRASTSSGLKRNAVWLVTAIAVQVLLGVLTILSNVELYRALAHQAVAVFVLGFAVEQVCLIQKERAGMKKSPETLKAISA